MFWSVFFGGIDPFKETESDPFLLIRFRMRIETFQPPLWSYDIKFFLDFQQERYVKWAEQQIENGKRLQEKLAQNPNNGR